MIEYIYWIAVGIVAVIAVWKAYSNDKKITKEEWETIKELIQSANDNKPKQ